MSERRYQFRLASLVWLVIVSALLLGALRAIQSGAAGRAASWARLGIKGELARRGIHPRHMDFILFGGLIFGVPILWLFLRRNPMRGRRSARPPEPNSAAPIDRRIRQFMSNVEPVETPPSPASTATVLPASTDGAPPRSSDSISHLLRRIRGPEPGPAKPQGDGA